VPQGKGKSLLLRPFPCRTHERPLLVLQLLHCIQSPCRSGSPLSTLTTYRRYLRFKRVIGARIVHLLLDDGKHCSNGHTGIRRGSPVFLTCGKSDGRLPLEVSYSTTCSHQLEIVTHLISQNRDAYTSLLIDPRMVDLSGERHLGRITNVSRRAVMWNTPYRWCFERKILWKRKLEVKRATFVRTVRLYGSQNPRSRSENYAPPPL
jgi:hypothetical protein